MNQFKLTPEDEEFLSNYRNKDGSPLSKVQREMFIDLFIKGRNLEIGEGTEDIDDKLEKPKSGDNISASKIPLKIESPKTEPEKPRIITTTNLQTQENYILLPQTNEHPDLLISKNRLSCTPEIEEIIEMYKLQSCNIGNNFRGYVGNINWVLARNLNDLSGNFTLNLRLFAEFLKLLKSGRAFDGTGRKVDSSELEQILNEIIEVRSSWRAEWLDDKYTKQGTRLQVTYHKFDSSGKLIEVIEQFGPNTLIQNKTPGIDLENWINNPTSQGLPKTNVNDGGLYYWQPVDGRVAWFDAGAAGVFLDCGGDPAGSGPALGVRAAKIFKKN